MTWSSPTRPKVRTGFKIWACNYPDLPPRSARSWSRQPDGFEWATEPDPVGAALAEFFPSPTSGQGDLYINPQVKSDLGSAGTTLPLGGSTGSLIQLANGAILTVTINYQGQTSPDVETVLVSGLTSATYPMPAVSTPGYVVGTFQMTDDGQDGTGQNYEKGFVHFVVTAPSGYVL